jgi:glycosyltransferase involved in cell wall biosynthesis
MLIEPGRTGLLLERADVATLEAAIEDLVADDIRRDELATRGREKILSSGFAVQDITAIMLGLYRGADRC